MHDERIQEYAVCRASHTRRRRSWGDIGVCKRLDLARLDRSASLPDTPSVPVSAITCSMQQHGMLCEHRRECALQEHRAREHMQEMVTLLWVGGVISVRRIQSVLIQSVLRLPKVPSAACWRPCASCVRHENDVVHLLFPGLAASAAFFCASVICGVAMKLGSTLSHHFCRSQSPISLPTFVNISSSVRLFP